jgi:hypothetical protein
VRRFVLIAKLVARGILDEQGPPSVGLPTTVFCSHRLQSLGQVYQM